MEVIFVVANDASERTAMMVKMMMMMMMKKKKWRINYAARHVLTVKLMDVFLALDGHSAAVGNDSGRR